VAHTGATLYGFEVNKATQKYKDVSKFIEQFNKKTVQKHVYVNVDITDIKADGSRMAKQVPVPRYPHQYAKVFNRYAILQFKYRGKPAVTGILAYILFYVKKEDQEVTLSPSHLARIMEYKGNNMTEIEVIELLKKELDEIKKDGNVVITTIDGDTVIPLKELIKQPVSGILYDLNRDELTLISTVPAHRYTNDYATIQVIRELKEQLDEANFILEGLRK